MISMKCHICKKDIIGPSFEATVNEHGIAPGPNDLPIVVCSERCKTAFAETLPFKGQPVDHMSRITGYYQRLSNWNKGKKQEWKDRMRHTV